VVNRDDGGRNGAVKPADAEKALGRKLELRVPNDFKTVREASDCGQALSQVRRKSPVEKALRAMLSSTVPSFEEKGARKQPFFGFKFFS
jgi:Flp pilus assembly CpaE family ATPase